MPRDSKQRFPATGIDLLVDEESVLGIARWIPKSLQYKPDIRPPSTWSCSYRKVSRSRLSAYYPSSDPRGKPLC
jgi:hypothetical protein